MADANLLGLQLLAQHAGLNADRARVAAAIAMAESGGNQNAHNSKPPDDSYGFWQINMIGALGPARRKQFGLKANSDLFDPMTNARAMAAISKNGGDFHPWTTYTSGAYIKFMGGNPDGKGLQSGLNNTGVPVLDAAAKTAEAAGQVASGVAKAAGWLSTASNWVRIGYVVGGSVVLTGAVLMLVKDTGPGQAAATIAKGPAGLAKQAKRSVPAQRKASAK